MTATQVRLSIFPCPLDEANAFVRQHHRHHGATVGHKFSLSVAGWRIVAKVAGQTWDRPGRPRVDKHPTQGKFRWEPSS